MGTPNKTNMQYKTKKNN